MKSIVAILKLAILIFRSSKSLEMVMAMQACREKERRRIAGEFHDRLGSILAAARMQFEAGTEETINGNINLQKAQILLDRAIDETRSIAHNLTSSRWGFKNLPDALADLKECLEVRGRLEIDLQMDEFLFLDNNREHQIFRLIQEFATNTLKHSDARKLSIHLQAEKRYLNLHLKDDGKGFKPGRISEGFGLKNMRKRLDLMGGKLRITSSPGKGSFFKMQIPISHEAIKATVS